ncbi:hypothetical protein R3P38DRAFT_3360108 [Favolaschia claudopus]|uniref:Uncharacterized protein n=1 Tax=Favolaschia claudopus TaxID=2862362 RepID=A0AAW0AXU5_9AGAR
MPASMFHLLFACSCFRSRGLSKDNHTVIPTESTHLISETANGDRSTSYQSTAAGDRQRLHERMDSIVRSKEGKMVNVNAHAPFILRHANGEGHTANHIHSNSAGPSSPISPTSPLPSPTLHESDYTNHHPHVVTMTPARMRLRADSRFSSRSGSRSSSLRRYDPSDRLLFNNHAGFAAERVRHTPPPPPSRTLAAEVAQSVSTSSSGPGTGDVLRSSPASPIGIHHSKLANDADHHDSIAFSWSET